MDRRTMILTLAAATAAAGVPAPLRSESGKTHHVEIREFEFFPAELKVRPGDRIVWVNLDIVPHTATARDESWDTGNLEQGEKAEIAVTDSFSGDYFCRFHPSMEGKVLSA
ncbi:MAG: cupredoxin family copper-binding protein [Pseudomonadota bacterium]